MTLPQKGQHGLRATPVSGHPPARPVSRLAGDEQCALRELERRESDLPNGFRTARSPAKPPGDHQMKNEKEIILKREDDPLAKAAKLDNPLPLCGADRHIDRAKEEWAREPHLLERLV